MESNWNFSPSTYTGDNMEALPRMAQKTRCQRNCNSEKPRLGDFKKITPQDMPEIWKYLQSEPGRTTDFSYGGVLMWVDYFNYEYSICNETLFIKGAVENDLSKPAFSLPVGKLPLYESIKLLKEYCDFHNIDLEFSAVPEYALGDMKALSPSMVEELADWGDYLYDASPLATLKGKKMSKKRNHVNQFVARYSDWKAVALTPENSEDAMAFMDVFDKEGDSTEMAEAERVLSRFLIDMIKCGDKNLEGMILYADGKVAAYTIGDRKGDTLFIHVEKATRAVIGSYEMINYMFAKYQTEKHPEILYINREDDAGDIGLRMAKESYHPKEILKKYNIIF